MAYFHPNYKVVKAAKCKNIESKYDSFTQLLEKNLTNLTYARLYP